MPGWLDFTPNNRANTNLGNLVNAKISPDTKNAGIYKCPGDIYPCMEFGQKMARVWSVGMNGSIEGGAYGKYDHAADGSHWYPGWWSYQKMSDIKNPPPSMLWVFVDEQGDSINDAWTIMGGRIQIAELTCLPVITVVPAAWVLPMAIRKSGNGSKRARKYQ